MGNRELTMTDAFGNALGTGQAVVLALLNSPLRMHVKDVEMQLESVEKMRGTSKLLKLTFSTIVVYRALQQAAEAGMFAGDSHEATHDATLSAQKCCELMLQMMSQHNPKAQGRERAIVRFNRELRIWDPKRVILVK